MPTIKSVEVECDLCNNSANFCRCQGCHDSEMEKEYERGKADGKEEAEEKEEIIEE